MHAVGVPVLLCSSVISLRERNKKRHGKARTSSKGERGSKGKDKQKARELTHFIRRCVLRVTEQSTTSRIAKQTSQITSEKHEVRRRTKQSTSTNEAKHDVVEAKHDVIKAKHGVRVRSKARRLSCLNLRKAFFSSLRRSRRRGRGRATGQQCAREPGDCARNPGAMPPKKPP